MPGRMEGYRLGLLATSDMEVSVQLIAHSNQPDQENQEGSYTSTLAQSRQCGAIPRFC